MDHKDITGQEQSEELDEIVNRLIKKHEDELLNLLSDNVP